MSWPDIATAGVTLLWNSDGTRAFVFYFVSTRNPPGSSEVNKELTGSTRVSIDKYGPLPSSIVGRTLSRLLF